MANRAVESQRNIPGANAIACPCKLSQLFKQTFKVTFFFREQKKCTLAFVVSEPLEGRYFVPDYPGKGWQGIKENVFGKEQKLAYFIEILHNSG